MLVSSISDAEEALGGKWEDKQQRTFKEAARLLAAAREGGCKPAIAFQAFKRAAREQRMLQSVRRSSALKMYDDIIKSLF